MIVIERHLARHGKKRYYDKVLNKNTPDKKLTNFLIVLDWVLLYRRGFARWQLVRYSIGW
jgi:hypothetical protein